MPAKLVRATRYLAVLSTFAAGRVWAQGAPPTAAFPEPAPAQPPAPQPAPTPQPAPAPPPAAASPAAPPPPPAAAPPPPSYEQAPIYEPPPPPEPPRSKRSIPEMSIRVDPFNLLIDGKLGIELEAAVLKWMSVELVPIFVVNDTPPTFNYFTGPDGLKRDSNGWGPLAGTSIDAGFWLQGKAMEGNVLRVILTNYGYKYTAPLDHVSVVERQLYGYFGSQSRFGAFTIAGGIGLGGELHKQRRCYVPNSDGTYRPSEQCSDNALLLRTDKVNAPGLVPSGVDLSGGLAGIQILARFSLGVVF